MKKPQNTGKTILDKTSLLVTKSKAKQVCPTKTFFLNQRSWRLPSTMSSTMSDNIPRSCPMSGFHGQNAKNSEMLEFLFQEAYVEMIEKRLRGRNQRPQTPAGMTLAERIMWKRSQMNEEQSYRQTPKPQTRSQDEKYSEEVSMN